MIDPIMTPYMVYDLKNKKIIRITTSKSQAELDVSRSNSPEDLIIIDIDYEYAYQMLGDYDQSTHINHSYRNLKSAPCPYCGKRILVTDIVKKEYIPYYANFNGYHNTPEFFEDDSHITNKCPHCGQYVWSELVQVTHSNIYKLEEVLEWLLDEKERKEKFITKYDSKYSIKDLEQINKKIEEIKNYIDHNKNINEQKK